MRQSAAFGDETDHRFRWFNCGWGSRAETVEAIARRVQAMARSLRDANPAFSPIRLQVSMWGGWGDGRDTVESMSIGDLAGLIDRKCRFDPPQLPAAVSPTGYYMFLPEFPVSDHRLEISVSAGRTDCEFGRNECVLRMERDAPVWRNPAQGLALVRMLVGVWEPDVAGAWAGILPDDGEPDDGRIRFVARPWITWRRAGADPAHYKLVDGPGPEAVSDEMGGELRVWA